MTARVVPWFNLRPGDLFQSRDDLYPLRVVHVLSDSLLVMQGMTCWRVYFRPGVRVLRFVQ